MSKEYPNHNPPKFRIIARIEGKDVRLMACNIFSTVEAQHFEITAGNKTLVFETNRPMIRRRSLKSFPWTWKLISGQLANKSAQEAIIEALEKYLRDKDKAAEESAGK